MADFPSPTLFAAVCSNPTCPHYAQVRTVGGQHLGQSLYLTGPLSCGCGAPAHSLTDAQASVIEDLSEVPTLDDLLAILAT